MRDRPNLALGFDTFESNQEQPPVKVGVPLFFTSILPPQRVCFRPKAVIQEVPSPRFSNVRFKLESGHSARYAARARKETAPYLQSPTDMDRVGY